MRVDLHNHTTRCNHATGSMEEYILRAIELGIDVYGFSDHAPMDFDPKYRMSLDQVAGYENEVLHLQKKYKDQITVLLGYEVDYLQGHIFDEVLNANVDYLIGSVHFIDKWGFDNPEFIGEYKNKDINKIWEDYFDAITQMAKTQHFDIVGHLDLIKLFKFMPTKDIRILAHETMQQIKKSNMSIEINPAGLRKPIAQAYPSKTLLTQAYELDIPITFGSDAHSVDQVGFKYDQAVALAKEVGYSSCAIYKNRKIKMVDF
ncbi:MAG: histidinol-phosphatase HisJ [Campylobacterota bacterium]|nr:histidinol-phosphatase HisJ [Campylobacterota bacterium]